MAVKPEIERNQREELPPWLAEHPGGTKVDVYVQPGAKRNQIQGERDGLLWVRVSAPPVEGRANQELLRFLADMLGLPRSRLELVRGESSRRKSVLVRGPSPQQVHRSLIGHANEGDGR